MLHFVRALVVAAALTALASSGAVADVLDDAAALIKDGKPAEAAALLEGLAESDVSDPIQLRFMRGVALTASGRPEQAIEEFRPILARNPELTRVRLELARAYFEAGQYDRAEDQFRQVLGGDLPPAVRQNVLAALDVIKRDQRWSGGLSIGIAPDSNISGGSSEDTIVLFGREFDLDEDAQEQSGVGFEASGVIRRIFGAPSKRTRPVAQASFFLREYPNDQFDDYNVAIGGGLERRFDGGSVYAGPRYARRWFGGEPRFDTVGLEARGQRRLAPKLLGFGFGFAGVQDDLRDNISNDRAELLSASVGLQRPLTSSMTATGRIGWAREIAEAKPDSFTRLSAAAELSAEVPYGFRAAVGASAAVQMHDARNPIFDARENRQTYTGDLTISNRLMSFWGFSPGVRLEFTHQESDVTLLDYDRTRLLLSVERTF